jgi:ABC-type bacteriocin/lantibiotic exporter with double-glycine peptidase domain
MLGWAWSMTVSLRWKLCMAVLMEIISAALMLYFVYCSKKAIDIAMDVIPGSLKMMLIHIVLSVSFSIVMSMAGAWIMEYSRNVLMMRFQNTLTHAQLMKSWETKKQLHTGDVLVRLTTDCSDVVNMIVNTFPTLIVTCVKLTASLIFLWVMDPILAQLILAITPLFLFSKLYYRKMRKITKEVKQAESFVGVVIQENLKFRSLIQSLMVNDVREKKLTEAQESLFRTRNSYLNFSILSQSILKMTFDGGYLLAFLWGVYRLHEGLISYGTMVAFLQLVARVQIPIFSIVSFVPSSIKFRTALERLMELNLGIWEDYQHPVKFTSSLTLKVNNLSFQYDDTEVIRNLNVEFKSGVPTAVTGASGKGKTTLIRLILAIIKPASGSLNLIHKGKSHEISVATRNNISYVPQGNTLFYGTIRENLLLADVNATDDMIYKALQTSCAMFVYDLPMGLDTMVGEMGQGLSEGQAQRIAVARALLHGGSIWLFDETTSALDSDMIHKIFNNLIEAGKDKILIFVTHDSYVKEGCSQIIQLD